jgi:hypothetical protein
MTANVLVAILSLFVLGPLTQKTPKQVPVADAYYWTGPERNLGIEMTGKFQSEDRLKDVFNLSKAIGTFKDKRYPFEPTTWMLRDILISADFNANGSVATWRVSGPKSLLLGYLARLKEEYEDKSVFYDFSYRFIDFKPSTD